MGDYFIDRTHKRLINVDEFQHHGVEGQRWGVITRNVGVNYIPKGRRNAKQEIESINNMFIKNYSYGFVKDGKVQGGSKEMFDKNFKLQSPEQFDKNKGGICYDYTEAQSKYYKDKGYAVDKYFMESDTGTHTFIVVKDGKGSSFYPEASLKGISGTFPAKDQNDVINVLKPTITSINGYKGDSVNYSVYKYTGHPQYGSNYDQCESYYKSSGKLVQQGTLRR